MKNLLIFILAMSYNLKSAFSSDEEGENPSFFDELIDNQMSINIYGSGEDESGSGDIYESEDYSGSSSGSFITPKNKTNEKKNNSSKTRNYVSIIVVVVVIGVILLGGVMYKLYQMNDSPVHNVRNVNINQRPPSFNGTTNQSYLTTMVEQRINPDRMYTINGTTNVSQCTNV